jgi:hypothetical protein
MLGARSFFKIYFSKETSPSFPLLIVPFLSHQAGDLRPFIAWLFSVTRWLSASLSLADGYPTLLFSPVGTWSVLEDFGCDGYRHPISAQLRPRIYFCTDAITSAQVHSFIRLIRLLLTKKTTDS